MLEGFYVGRALAQTLNARLAEVVVDALAEAGKALAEAPRRVQQFQVRAPPRKPFSYGGDSTQNWRRKRLDAGACPGTGVAARPL